jgi:hypothetical protein
MRQNGWVLVSVMGAPQVQRPAMNRLESRRLKKLGV